MVASSTSIIGISSRTGYTRLHSAHFRLVPSAFSVSGFLHTGHTRMSINSFSIIAALYAADYSRNRFAPGHELMNKTGYQFPGDALFDAIQ